MKKIRAFNSGFKNGPWTENKFTNLTPYSPFYSQADKVVYQHLDQMQKEGLTYFFEYQPIAGFVRPINMADIKKVIAHIPDIFITDLKGVFLCPGSKKQGRFSSNVFGCYSEFYKSICIFPFPDDLCFYFKNRPKPSVCLEYERHGAKWKQDERYWQLEFNLESLRSFYLRDVLVHEIGHHVDNISLSKDRSNGQKERFAEWFAIEFGMRSANKQLTELGQVIQGIIKQESERL